LTVYTTLVNYWRLTIHKLTALKMATDITMPQMGFDMTEGTIAAWLKNEGDTVTKGEPIAEIETDKTTIQIEAFSNGVLAKIVGQAGAKMPVGSVIGVIAAPGEKVDVTAASSLPANPNSPVKDDAQKTKAVEGESPVAKNQHSTEKNGRIFATPIARRIAEEKGLNLSAIKGTGPEGRIVKADVEAALASGVAKTDVMISAPTPLPEKKVEPLPANVIPTQSATPAVTSGKKPLSRMRQTIAQRMAQAKSTVPHYYVTNTVEMDSAMQLRSQINESLKPEGVKVSVNDLVVKAVALALKRYPNMNATFASDSVEMRETVHIGIAVSMEGGLVVVTLRDADKKTLKQIGAEVPSIAARVREGKGQPGDMGGQTFTTSNLGMHGVEEVYPIINLPDAGILGIGGAAQTPVVREGQIVIRTMMNLVLAADHRVTDGLEGAQFLAEIKRLLENPWSLVL
jgi:pyruvate dehydrogenase E2 component (dihydrolipoamide acetyltransferase)